MKNYKAIAKFWELQKAGKSAVLDISQDGEMECRYTVANNAERTEGNGTPPAEMTEKWTRVAVCEKGIVSAPKHFK